MEKADKFVKYQLARTRHPSVRHLHSAAIGLFLDLYYCDFITVEQYSELTTNFFQSYPTVGNWNEESYKFTAEKIRDMFLWRKWAREQKPENN